MKLKEKENSKIKICDSRFSVSISDEKILCNLCPIKCRLSEGQNGKCRVRQNLDGRLCLVNYSGLVQANLDHLENRPIYLLGEKKKSLSIGLTGCNNTCPFCQNWEVSQKKDFDNSIFLPPEEVIEEALKNKVDFISLTYTEPIVWIEYLLEVSKLARLSGIKICVKTAGYISEEFFDILIDSSDAINLDIKPLDKDYLIKCGIFEQEIVWNLAKRIVEKKVHLEISHIVINGVNDNLEKMENFSKEMMVVGSDIAIHLLKHYPAWKSKYPTTDNNTMILWKNFLIEKGHINVFSKEVG